MKYNFNDVAQRRNTNSLKWDLTNEGELPMWVADMDYKCPPFVIQAIEERIKIGAFGYSLIPEEFFDSVIGWWKRRHNIEFKREWMIYCSGVVAAVSSIVRSMTNIGDNVILQSPTYNIFYNSILNNKRIVLSNDLVYENGVYHIDFVDLEKKMSLEKTSLMILCNPHNPIGHIWNKEDLTRIGELAKKYNVIVLSDEIHCDLVEPGYSYLPFAFNDTNKEVSITCLAASKTFNMAGLQSACVIVPNENIRKRVDRGLNNDEVAEPNFFSMAANIAAFTKGDEWVDQLNEYIYENKKYLYNFIDCELPNLKVIKDHALYLVWIDISYYSNDSKAFVEELRKQTGLFVNEGEEYGTNGKSFIRINLATSLENVKDGCNRLKRFVENIKKE